jgi:hypothetical protein
MFSAVHPTTDIAKIFRHVRFVPLATDAPQNFREEGVEGEVVERERDRQCERPLCVNGQW